MVAVLTVTHSTMTYSDIDILYYIQSDSPSMLTPFFKLIFLEFLNTIYLLRDRVFNFLTFFLDCYLGTLSGDKNVCARSYQKLLKTT